MPEKRYTVQVNVVVCEELDRDDGRLETQAIYRNEDIWHGLPMSGVLAIQTLYMQGVLIPLLSVGAAMALRSEEDAARRAFLELIRGATTDVELFDFGRAVDQTSTNPVPAAEAEES